MPKRYVENDLNKGPSLQPTVRQRDDFQQVHGVALNQTDWSALSRSLTNALASYTDLYGTEQRKMGATEFTEELARAEQEHGDMQKAFAQAVAKGEMAMGKNPYFKTGYLESLAENLSGRMHAEASPKIRHGYDLDKVPNPVTGVAPAAEPSQAPAQPVPGTHYVTKWQMPDGSLSDWKPPG